MTPRSNVSNITRNFLTELVDELIEPEKTLRAVQKRFIEEGQGPTFDALLAEVSSTAAQNYLPGSSQTPSTRSMGGEVTPSALASQHVPWIRMVLAFIGQHVARVLTAVVTCWNAPFDRSAANPSSSKLSQAA